RRDCRAASLRHFHERVSGAELGFRPRTRARGPRGLRTAGRTRCAAAASRFHRLRRIQRAGHTGARLLSADIRPPGLGPHRRAVYACGAGRLVPERGRVAQMTQPHPSNADPSRPDPFDGLSGRTVAGHRPWPRREVQAAIWTEAADRLSRGLLTMLGLWGELKAVHMALADAGDANRILVLTLACPEGRYPSVGRVHAPAIRLERAAADLFQLLPVGLPDTRPWLNHGKWADHGPLPPQTHAHREPGEYSFLPVEGQGIHQLAVGPVHAAVIEPGHFRISADGDTVVRLE